MIFKLKCPYCSTALTIGGEISKLECPSCENTILIETKKKHINVSLINVRTVFMSLFIIVLVLKMRCSIALTVTDHMLLLMVKLKY